VAVFNEFNAYPQYSTLQSKNLPQVANDSDLQHLLENTFDQKRISTNPIPNFNPIPNLNPNPSFIPILNPKAQQCFRTDEMTSFFEKVYRYPTTR